MNIAENIGSRTGGGSGAAGAFPPWRLVRRRLADLSVPPDAPRAEGCEPSEIEALAASIAEHGLIVPILIEPEGMVRAGVRRLHALRSLGRDRAECLIVPAGSDPNLIALVENLHRRDLSAAEEARAYRLTLDRTGWSQARLARELGVSPAKVSLALNLLDAPPAVLEKVERGEASAYEIKCAFSEAGRRDGRAQRARSIATAPNGRFSRSAVKVAASRLPSSVRARALLDRYEVTVVILDSDAPLQLVSDLLPEVEARLGPAMKVVLAELRRARGEVCQIEGLDEEGKAS